MKRAILVLFALTFVLAVPLAGCGLTQVAGSVLLGGGGLSLALITALALIGGRATAPAPRIAPAAPVSVAASTPGPQPEPRVVEATAPAPRAPGIEVVTAQFVNAAVEGSAPAGDDFGADELAFFAEGETLSLRPSDSSPSWQLG